MKKIFSLLLVTICCFGFISVVNAEEAWSSITDDASFVSKMIERAPLDGTNATAFFEKYDVYYTYVKIDDTTFNTYLNDRNINNVSYYIPTVNEVTDLGSWTKITDPNLSYTNLEYDQNKKTGYLVAVAAIPKTDTSKIYVYREVCEVTGTTSLVTSSNISYETDTNVNEEPVVEENPNTGISDYAIYLVPIALIGGTVLMMRKNYA